MSNETNIMCVNTCFRNNLTIKGVDCANLPWYRNSMVYAFQGCSNLETVTNLNQNIVLMGYSFANCTNMVSAPEIPNSVVNMPGAFANCSNLVNAPNIPDGVVSMASTFINCRNLVNAPNIPNSVVNMTYTFGHCHNLANAPEIPNSVTDLQHAFYTCRNLTTAPEIPNSVVNMYGTFFQCSNLTTITNIPSSVVNMTNTFFSCSNLVSGPSIPNSVDDMYGTFYQCYKLENVPSIGNSVVNMASSFYKCYNIIAIPNIPSTVVNMSQTFFACSNIQSDIFIHSAKVEDATSCLRGVSNINVYIPCYNYQSNYEIVGEPRIVNDVDLYHPDANNYTEHTFELLNTTEPVEFMVSFTVDKNAPVEIGYGNPIGIFDLNYGEGGLQVDNQGDGPFIFGNINNGLVYGPTIEYGIKYWVKMESTINQTHIYISTDKNVWEEMNYEGTHRGLETIPTFVTTYSYFMDYESGSDIPSPMTFHLSDFVVKQGNSVIYEAVEREYSTTYNSFISAGYDENGTTDGIYLKDINSLPNALNDYEYVVEDGTAYLTKYVGTGNSVKVPMK
jgi:hypothetical protein